MAKTPLRIMIVDDHPLFIDALQLALRPLAAGAALVSASTLKHATALLAETSADLILLDLMLPDAGGVESVARVREIAPNAQLVVISGRDDSVTVSLARALGADGFISKASPLTEIQDQLRSVLANEAVFPEASRQGETAAAISALTPSQARVLSAAATGKLNKQIAHEMNLAEPTVKAHMSAIFKKLGVNNRTQAILALSDRSEG